MTMKRTSKAVEPKQESPRTDEIAGLPMEKVTAIVTACHARLGRPLSPHDLEEATQEVRVTGWMKKRNFRGESSPETWVYGIARLCILRQLSKTRRISSREVSISPTTHQPADPGIGPGSRFDTSLQVAVRRCLSRDGETMESIVRAHDVEGASFRQIAENLGMTEPAVKSRYHRSLPDLRRRLQKFWLDAVR